MRPGYWTRLLDSDRIDFPAESEALVEELKAFRGTRTTRGLRAEAEPGAHDDLVIALALAVLFEPHGQKVERVPNPFI